MTGRVLPTVGTSAVSQVQGVYDAVVVNSSDPLRQNRVQLKVPQVLGNAVSNWAKPLAQLSGANAPTNGQYVIAAFVGGDRNQPVYIPIEWSVSGGSANSTVSGNLIVDGTSDLIGAVTTGAGLSVANTLTVTAGGATIAGGATVTGGESLTGGLIADTISLNTSSTGSLLSVKNTHSSPTSSIIQAIANHTADPALGIEVNGDSVNRLQVDSTGKLSWGSGSGAADTTLYRNSSGTLRTDNDFWVNGNLFFDQNWSTISSFTAGWTGTIAHRLIGQNFMLIDVKLAPGTVADGTQICTLGGAYTPAGFKRVPMVCDNIKAGSTTYEMSSLYIGAAGQVEVFGVNVNATFLQGCAAVPLDV